MDYNTISNRQILINAFGEKLANDPKFKLTSACTYKYNCIAYAMGMMDRWVDVCDVPWHWWPAVPKNQTSESLIKAFEFFGFEKCGMDDSIEKEYEKIVLYEIDGLWQHAARVVSEDEYHSKFGESFDGLHSGGMVLFEKYGTPFQVMKRHISKALLTDQKKGEFEGFTRTGGVIKIGGYEDNVIIYKGKKYLEHCGNEVIRDGLTIRILSR